MPGTKAGGLKASETNRKRFGEDYYRNIGRQGGKLGKTGGFASKLRGPDGLTGKERASIAGAKGGGASRRGPKK